MWGCFNHPSLLHLWLELRTGVTRRGGTLGTSESGPTARARRHRQLLVMSSDSNWSGAGNGTRLPHMAGMSGGYMLLVRTPRESGGIDMREIWFAHIPDQKRAMHAVEAGTGGAQDTKKVTLLG